ncbi:MAG TPA: thiamine pyrophosphate-dependent enzyme, partial [Paracoccaceae bacterium]|nr:thiamine pyrophosphate-dependent enzyme [Paracoccaceae bacterium]
VANASQDRVPLIVISGAVGEAEALRYSHQVFDHRAVLGPLVKASFEARAGACDTMIDKALRLALDPRPGPVHVDLPVALAGAVHPPARAAVRGPLAFSGPAEGPDLEAARAMFRAAERPIMVAGLDGLTEPGAAEAVREVSARLGIPVVTSYKAKGVLAEDDPLCLGGHGLSPKSDAILLPLLRAADLVLACGYDPIEMRAGWQDPWEPAACIEFGAVANHQDMHGARVAWVSGVVPGLAALTAGAAPRPVWPAGEIGRTRARLAEAFSAAAGWGPAEALHLLNRLKPDGLVASVDSGAHRILMSQIWTCRAPGELIQSTGLCTMGCALPLAIGRKLAEPARPVMAVMGDGCLDMVLGELATLRDLALPIPVVVLVDGSLALIEMKQRREGLANAGVDFGVTDYAGLARVLGFAAWTVEDAPGLEAAFRAALAAEGPSLIAVRIPPRAYDGLI